MIHQRRHMLAGLAGMAGVAALGWHDQAPAGPSWNSDMPRVPDVALLNHRGESVPLRPLLTQGPVAVNFIYTGCTSFCPPQTAVFRQLQGLLAAEPGLPANLISLSIDPLGDTPQAIARFAQRYEATIGANTRWWMLTGGAARVRETDAVLRAFGAHATSLAEHPAQVWVGNAAKARWLRSLGLAGADDILQWLRASAA